MKQMTRAAGTGFEKHLRATRKAEFLARMEALIPWAEFCTLIEPHYPKAGNGRPPVGLERMLRMYCIANRAFAMLAMINVVKWGTALTAQVRPA